MLHFGNKLNSLELDSGEFSTARSAWPRGGVDGWEGMRRTEPTAGSVRRRDDLAATLQFWGVTDGRR